jgi:hypothetical protein
MKINKTLLALIAMTFLSACQNPGQTPSAMGPGSDKYQGPSDGGGGDTCNGKMIESFKVNIMGLDEYKELVQPIVEKLKPKTSDSTKNDNTPFLFSPVSKSWYIIDCKLQDIPKERKGLYLESYQTAIHTSREVFIDSTSYNTMAKEERAKLLIHEMVMGYYLMKYMSIEDMCKVGGAECSPDALLISKWKMYRPETYRPLNEEDHQRIRAVTAWLWSQSDALTPENFVKVLKSNDFDKRFLDQVDKTESVQFEVDPQILVRMFKKHQWSQTFPKFCQFDAITNASHSSCTTEVTSDIRDYGFAGFTLKQLYVKVKITRDSDKKVFENEFSFPLQNADTKITLHENKFGVIAKAVPMFLMSNWPNQPGVTMAEGMRSHTLFLMMNFADRENPEIFQMNLKPYVWYSFEENIVIKEGMKYKETYGYSSPLEDEAENLFTESELPFTFRANMPTKNFIKMELVP